MNTLIIVFGILLILCSVALIVLVMFQEQKGHGLSGAIGGDMGNAYAGRSRGMDAKMNKLTRVIGIVFFVLVVAVSLLSYAVA